MFWSLTCWLGGASARGQFPFPGPTELSDAVFLAEVESGQRTQLARVDALLADGQHDEAIETLRRVVEDHETKLMETAPAEPGAGVVYVPLREWGQRKLAALRHTAPEALAAYRAQVDPLAEQWLRQALQSGEESPLERIVERMFVSSAGDDALWRWGEQALQRGDHALARACWERISPVLRSPEAKVPPLAGAPGAPWYFALRGAARGERLTAAELDALWPAVAPWFDPKTLPEAPRGWTAYPDSPLHLADARARLALVSILEGDAPRAELELLLLRKLHPEAEGRLAGQTGRWVDLLTNLLKESAAWPPRPAMSDWPTFGGDFARNGKAPRAWDLAGAPAWSAPLVRFTADKDQLLPERERVGESGEGLLSHFPIVVGDTVWLADPLQVRALERTTGRPRWPRAEDDASGLVHGVAFDGPTERLAAYRNLIPSAQGQVGVARCTLSAARGALLLRMGSPRVGDVSARVGPRDERSALAALDMATHKPLFERLYPDEPRWEFEGAPVTDGASLFVATRHKEAQSPRSQLYVACHDLQTGQRRWRTLVCGAATAGQGEKHELSHTLLTLDQGVLYCNTNLGAVAALGARDGVARWLVKYPRAPYSRLDRVKNGLHFFRDLNPCVLYRGLCLAAPADCESILGIDAASGQVLWRTSPGQAADAIHLLGVGANNLLASGDRLYWIDAQSGRFVGAFPEGGSSALGLARPEPRGQGRGLLAGDWVYFPTRDAIYLFAQRTQRVEGGWRLLPATPAKIDLAARGVEGGHLIPAGDLLLIAGADRLTAWPGAPLSE